MQGRHGFIHFRKLLLGLFWCGELAFDEVASRDRLRVITGKDGARQGIIHPARIFNDRLFHEAKLLFASIRLRSIQGERAHRLGLLKEGPVKDP